MQELLDKLVTKLQGLGGSAGWEALKEGLTYPEQQNMPQAIRLGESQGVLRRNLAWDSEAKTMGFTVDLGGD